MASGLPAPAEWFDAPRGAPPGLPWARLDCGAVASRSPTKPENPPVAVDQASLQHLLGYHMAQADIPDEHREALLRLRGKLADNEKVLRAHLSAVGEVASLIRDAIQKAEADGTYSVNEFGAGRAT